jgi:ubiquinone biosynthesis protein
MGIKNENERMREIISVFSNNGIKKIFQGKNVAPELRKSFEQLGPTFIKIGQILSTSSDILPEEYIKEFRKLQDNVEPEPYEKIKNVMENSLKKPVEQIFSEFCHEAHASASVAQVHMAYLKDGTKVAVKILRPEVREEMAGDIAVLKRLAKHTKYVPQSKTLNLSEIIEELKISANKEMNFLIEAENIKKFSEYNKDVRYVTVPKVYNDYTTDSVLVMDYIEGIKISDTEKLSDEGYYLEDIGLKLTNNYLKQIFGDGFFHADPHPGNLIIKENKITYIDFGIVGELDSSLRESFNNFLLGIIFGDIDEMSQAVLEICNGKDEVDIKEFKKDVEKIYGKYIETSLSNVDLNTLINDILSACRKNELKVPKEITMLLRGIITIEGVLEKLSPEVKITEMLLPYVKEQVIKKADIKKEINDIATNLYFLAKSAPETIKTFTKLINNASSGRLKIQMEPINFKGSVKRLDNIANRLIYAIIISSLIMGSSIMAGNDVGPRIYGISAIALAGYGIAVVIGLLLLISMIISRK